MKHFGRFGKSFQFDTDIPWNFVGRDRVLDSEDAGGRAALFGKPAVNGGDDTPTVRSNEITTSAIPTDPLFGLQWHLLNTGQNGGTQGIDINVVDVWEDYTGAGVTIGVVDTGIEYTHPDLSSNVNTDIDHNAGVSGSPDDASAQPGDNHATTVSGTIAATADNETGVAGVAYGADVAGFRMDFGTDVESQIAENLWLQSGVDISNNSWGFNGFFYDDLNSPVFADSKAAIENAVSTGRGGLGTVFVFAAGNDREFGQDVNYHGFQNSPYTITVAAIDNTGVIADFSTPGAAILVSAPGVGIVTTDRVGDDGYVSGDYVSISGTSFSSPITAGVIALMLEANPNLGYRDVQEILAYSARQIDSSDPGWEFNGATNWNGGGLHVSHDYGFGLIDAHAAVRLAETWTETSTFASLTTVSASSTPNVAIRDANRGNKPGVVKDTITISDGLNIDHVVVTLNLDHTWIGDLTVTLTSPDGTESLLINRPGQWQFNPFGTGQDDIRFDLSTTQDWGETGVGDWTLTVSDEARGDTGTLENWTLTLWGDPITVDDTYIYTDEFAQFAGAAGSSIQAPSDESGIDAIGSGTVGENADSGGGSVDIAADSSTSARPEGKGNGKPKGDKDDDTGDAGRQLLSDDSGTDTINAAAVTTDTVLDLTPGATSILAGSTLTIDAGTVIEIAYLGDGNDTVTGNTAANELFGGRGDDILIGGAGDDTLIGGRGSDSLEGGTDADLFVFGTTSGGSSVIEDGNDTITDFDFMSEGDIVEMDALFDALGAGDAEARAAILKITDATDSVLTIDDAAADFSITFTGVNLGGGGTDSFGDFTVAELAALGIDVGS